MLLRRLVALIALAAFTFMALNTPPALAQTREEIMKRRPPPPKGRALWSWCQASVFLKNGSQGQNPYMNLTTKRPLYFMNSETAFSQTEHCVQVGGQGY